MGGCTKINDLSTTEHLAKKFSAGSCFAPTLSMGESSVKKKKKEKKNGPSSSKELVSIQEGKQNRKVCQIRAATGLGSWKAVMEINLWKAKQNT